MRFELNINLLQIATISSLQISLQMAYLPTNARLRLSAWPTVGAVELLISINLLYSETGPSLVQQALLEEGIIRSYGREFLTTYLRIHHRHRAREDDVRDALVQLDPVGNSGHRPGLDRRRRDKFIIPGPEWIWSIDGHDKFRNYGIEIYAAIDGHSKRII